MFSLKSPTHWTSKISSLLRIFILLFCFIFCSFWVSKNVQLGRDIKNTPENVESYLTFITIETSYNNVFKTKVICSDCRTKDLFSFLWCFPMGLMLCLINQTWCMHYMNTVQFVWNAFVCQLLKSLYDLKYTMYGEGFTKSTIANRSVS